jgi:hypothetical protein
MGKAMAMGLKMVADSAGCAVRLRAQVDPTRAA